jgi:hypothetical protein
VALRRGGTARALHLKGADADLEAKQKGDKVITKCDVHTGD